MPEVSVVEASRTIIGEGVIGAMLILTLSALVFAVRQWIKTLRELYDEKDARLKDWKEHATLAESMRNAMAANTTAIQAVLGYFK